MSPIRAEIIGDNIARAGGIMVTGHAPVLKLCRELVRAGHDAATPLEAYRGEVLCLRVRSIGEGAGLAVIETDGTPRFVQYRGQENPVTDRPIEFDRIRVSGEGVSA